MKPKSLPKKPRNRNPNRKGMYDYWYRFWSVPHNGFSIKVTVGKRDTAHAIIRFLTAYLEEDLYRG